MSLYLSIFLSISLFSSSFCSTARSLPWPETKTSRSKRRTPCIRDHSRGHTIANFRFLIPYFVFFSLVILSVLSLPFCWQCILFASPVSRTASWPSYPLPLCFICLHVGAFLFLTPTSSYLYLLTHSLPSFTRLTSFILSRFLLFFFYVSFRLISIDFFF